MFDSPHNRVARRDGSPPPFLFETRWLALFPFTKTERSEAGEAFALLDQKADPTCCIFMN
jgi:hypothetical protein